MLEKITDNKWMDEKHNYIAKDNLENYIVYIRGKTEIFDTLEKAIRFYEVFK